MVYLRVVMVLNEAPGEKNRSTWYSRLAQERRELSASVEEALVSTPLEESFWLDDLSQSATAIGTEHGKNVFPPRLSLQSRSLPGTSSSVGKGLMSTHRDTERHPSIWKRFTQRLTSSLVAFCFHPAVAATEFTPTLAPPVTQDDALTRSAQVKEAIQPASNSEARLKTTGEPSSSNKYSVGVGSDVRHGSSCMPHTAHNTQGRQRLAGRTTRIRLEVVPSPSASKVTDKEKHPLEPQKVPGALLKDRVAAHEKVLANAHSAKIPVVHSHNDITRTSISLAEGRAFFNEGGTSVRLAAIEKPIKRSLDDRSYVGSDGGTTSIRLPVVEKRARVAKRPLDNHPQKDDHSGTTSIRLPAVETGVKQQEESFPRWHAGSGMFECGQRDVTISDPSVTAASVVLVTLTANPGPVVVQYVSLQPRKSFTVHLTAPTTMGAPFNYIVLDGEKH
jgi:hypothetical protein